MKKMLIALTAICMMLGANAHTPVSKNVSLTKNASVKADFMKSSTQTWGGMMKGKMYWYKLDKSAKLWWSTDGKKWAEVKDGMWADKDGKWLKIGDGKLWWSADNGKSWGEVPEWKWEGPKGEWYKFDKDWTLWTTQN
jgi:hypothetical protein